jgi:hypothetical protein
MDFFLMMTGFLLLSILLVFTGAYMLYSPGRFAAACEAFAAAGNLPSLLSRSVKGALLQVRVFGGCSMFGGFLLLVGTLGLMPVLLHSSGRSTDVNWLIVPAMLGIAAGYVILVYATEWVARVFGKWTDHPLVPQELIVALTWELRVAGFAFTLFGLGAASVWLKGIFGHGGA